MATNHVTINDPFKLGDVISNGDLQDVWKLTSLEDVARANAAARTVLQELETAVATVDEFTVHTGKEIIDDPTSPPGRLLDQRVTGVSVSGIGHSKAPNDRGGHGVNFFEAVINAAASPSYCR